MGDGARSSHAGVQAQLDRLAALGMGGDVLGLERVSQLCARLGNPQDRLPPVFHVAGTNGKGSTIAFLRAAFEASGKTVHVFTSPHLVRFNERIRVAGQLIDDEALEPLLREVIDAADGMKVSFFEATTAAAFLHFSRVPADAVLIEVGLGGRFDATNIIEAPAVTAIAGLGMDHQAFLGNSLEKIAFEKAGIAKPGVPLVMQNYPAPVEAVLEDHAKAVGAIPFFHDRDWSIFRRGETLHFSAARDLDMPLPALRGRHQYMNAGLAAAMLQYQSAVELPGNAFAAMTRKASWPARLQLLDEGALVSLLPDGVSLWLDGGHNRDAAQAVAHNFGDRPLHLVIGLLSNRHPADVLAPFAGKALSVTALPILGHEHHDPAVLAARAAELLPSATIHTAPDARAALRLIAPLAAPGHDLLVFGSLYLAGAVLDANGTPPA